MVPLYIRYKSRGASTLAGGTQPPWGVGPPDATGLIGSVACIGESTLVPHGRKE